jgi:hypothetical protein
LPNHIRGQQFLETKWCTFLPVAGRTADMLTGMRGEQFIYQLETTLGRKPQRVYHYLQSMFAIE